MANEDLNKINRLEEIQRKLYSRTDPVHRKKDKKMDSISYGVPTGWGEEDSTGSSRSDLGTSRGPTSSRPGVGSEKMTEDGPFRHPMNKARPRSSIFKKFFYFSLLVLAGALVFSFFKIYKGGNVVSPENIDIIISANPFIQSGEEFDTEVSILNRNTSQIEVNSLALEYQKGFISSETPSQSPPYEGGEGVERKKFNIENVASGGTSLGNAKITLFGEQGSKRELKATLEYRIAGSSATFVKVQTFEVTFSSSPLIFTIDAPSSVNPNQDVTLSIKIASNTNTISKDMLVKAVYPIGFQFKESTPMPFVSDNVWFLGDLNPSAEKSIIIKGSMLGETGETKIINVLVGEKDKSSETGISTLYGSLTKTFLLEAPSLLVNLLVGGRDQAEYAFQSQKTVNASLSWANNQPGRLNDMEVRVKITGNALNKNSIKVKNGFYDIANDVLVWDKETIPAFASVEPGTQGILEFEFSSTSTQFPSLVVSPQIELLASISANRPNESNFFESIANSDRSKIVKLTSNLQLSARGLYSQGAFQNTGFIPPKAGQKTTYTVVWGLSNTTNDVARAEVRAKLPPFSVKWLGKISPTSENVSYNDASKEVVWRVGNIPRGTGLNGNPREVSFQIELTPSIAQIGSVPPLLEESVLTGEDTFANVTLKSTRSKIDTRISSDPAYKGADEIVVQ